MPLPPPRGRRLRGLVGLVGLAMLGTGCAIRGGGDTASTSTTDTTTAGSARPDFLATDVQVRAEDINFSQKAYTARAGEVKVGYVNESEIFHTLLIEAAGGGSVAGWERLEITEQGDVAIGTVVLGPGEYTLYCDVAGHRPAGMEATLTVEA